ncbi:MAG: RNA polymerase sigma factor [Dehalococcoidia bacterium]|nr:MAG: RNA polymerase sigma factor [Dehalococcoidia bacterium]
MDEVQVVSLVRNGNTEAFADIVDQYQFPISRYIKRLTGDDEVTKDLAQDTFLNAYEGILKTDSELSLKAWLYRIATNNVLQYKRRKRLISFIPFVEYKKQDNLSVDTKDLDNRMQIEEVFLKVPDSQRVCLALHYIEGFHYREIANILGISEDAVRMRVVRGSKEFQRLYKQGGG